MTRLDQVGLFASVITTIYTAFGLPVQIRKNYVHKSTEGLSLVLMIMLTITFSSWVLYASMKDPVDWYVVVSNAPGMVCAALILVQFHLYRGREFVTSRKTGTHPPAGGPTT